MDKKLLVYNDDGWSSLMRYPAPASVENITKYTVGQVAGTGTDIYQMCLNTGNIAIHNSRLLEKYGSYLEKPHRMYMWRTIETMESLARQGTDLLQVVIDACHNANIECHASVRMNDKHHTFRLPEGLPERFYRTEYFFPDLRSRWIEQRPEICLPDGSLDMAFEEARQFRIDVISEVLENYNVDGIDLDFTRFPPYFKEGEKEENAHKLTELVKEIREMVNKKSEETGRNIKLTARVEYNAEINKAEGVDVDIWIKNGYLDILYLGVICDATPDEDISKYTKLCGKSSCILCPSMEGFFYWMVGGYRLGPYKATTSEVMRAFASNAYAQGAGGIQMFNFCCTDEPWDKDMLNQLPYMNQIEFSDKKYVFTMGPRRGAVYGPFWDSEWMMQNYEDEKQYSVFLSENLDKAKRCYNTPLCTLMMRFKGLNKKDDIQISINDVILEPEERSENCWDWDGWSDVLYFNIPISAIRTGKNQLNMKRMTKYDDFIGELEVIEMELDVNYLGKNIIGKI